MWALNGVQFVSYGRTAMCPSGPNIVVHKILPGQPTSCRVYTNVPLDSPVLIAIISCGSPEAIAAGNSLADELDRLIRNIDPDITESMVPCLLAGHSPTNCEIHKNRDFRRVLVAVGDETTPLILENIPEPWLHSRQPYPVLPLFPLTAKSGVSSRLPANWKKINADFFDRSPSECIPAILATAGITAEVPRVFLSYCQKEARNLVVQLFDSLSHENFDVFVDNFRVPPGVDFQARLTDHLGDKGVIVVVESPTVLLSEWTTYEIHLAIECRLGLVGLHLPNGVVVQGIDDEQRLRLSRDAFAGSFKGDGSDRLTDSALLEVVNFVKCEHDRALLRRRKLLRLSMQAALIAEGVSPTVNNHGIICARGGDSANAIDYLIWLTTRAPETIDFHRLHRRYEAPCKGIVVGLTRLMQQARIEQSNWLAGLCAVALVDEGQMRNAAVRIARAEL